MRTFLSLLAATALALACVACGSTSSQDKPSSSSRSASDQQPSRSSSPSASGSPSTAALPSCDSVWHAGARLDERYYGCTTNDGRTVSPQGTYCESGQYVVTYDNRFYAALGGKIKSSPDLRHDRSFHRQFRACTA